MALPRPAALLLMVGSGRAALIALDALVLRRRLPWSPVFWNLRTRSSDEAGLAPFDTTSHYATAPICFFVPEEPLESSDMLDPDRSGTLVDSMVRVVVRGCVDMVRRCQLHSWSSRHRQLELCCHEMLQRKKKSLPLSKNAERVSKRRAWAPRETYADMSNGPGYSGESDRRSVMSRANGYRNYSGLGNVAAQKARRGVAAKGARWSLLR